MELITEGFVLFITLFIMMLGLVFTLIPPLPGTLIIWGAAIMYGLVLGWEKLGWASFGMLTFFMLVGIAADVLAGQFGARMGGASCLAIVAGTVLGFVLGIAGSLFTPIVGCLAGMLGVIGGIVLVERIRYKDWESALKATKGYVAGATAGMMAKATSGVIMLIIFFVTVLLMG